LSGGSEKSATFALLCWGAVRVRFSGKDNSNKAFFLGTMY